MDKTISIDGKDIQLKSTGANPLIYRNQFNRDYFADLLSLAKTFPMDSKGNVKNPDKWTKKETLELDMQPLYNFLWSVAKNANMKISEPIEWYMQFEDFAISDVLEDVQELLMQSVQGKKH